MINNLLYIFLVSLILLISIILKIHFYFIEPSFSGDEANLIIPIINKNIENIMFYTKAPGELAAPLYFFIQKFIANILGINEYSMRLLSLLFGIANLFIFVEFAKEFLNKKLSIIFAITLFSINLSQIYFSTMTKPYIIDVTILMLFLLYLSKTIKGNKLTAYTLKSYIIQFLSFCFAYLISIPAIFIGPTTILILIINEFIKKTEESKKIIINLLYISALNIIFLAFYFGLYLIQFKSQSKLNNEWLIGYGFFPNTKERLAQLIDLLFDSSSYWDKTNDTVLYCILSLVSLSLILYSINIAKKKESLNSFCILILPVFVMLFLGALHLYPFANRLILFLLPIFIILISKTIDYINEEKWLLTKIFIILMFFYIINSTYIEMYKKIIVKKSSPWETLEYKTLYKNIREIPSCYTIVIGDALFLTTYVYNHIYNFKPSKIIYTYKYPELLEYIDFEQHIQNIKNDKEIYMLYAVYTERDNIDKFKKELLDKNYISEIIATNGREYFDRGLVILEKYKRK